ncbi:cytochrome P450 6k1 isoform X1 [Anoplophora glabripennis]|uniref:cytochrome P450 6k1 isoform X1 n=1 Tax=Anoplophora glabripennis TaxID=217634 RepID=UPI0008746B39|nr:cytochrome P450 6k1 isoform X1 [Anoplophora glabripennis]
MAYWVILKHLFPNWQTLVLLAVLFYLVYRYSTRNHDYWKKRGVPFEKPVFLAGSLWEVFKGQRHVGKHLGHLYKKYNTPYFGIYIMGKPYLVLRNPNIIKTITIRDFTNFDDRTFACDKNADAISGNSLFILRNPDWKDIRNKLTPIFTSGKLKLMFPIMKQCCREMIIFLDKHDGDILEIKEVSAKYMTDLVASCFFGLEINSFGEKDSEFRIFSRKMLDFDVYTSFCLFSYFFVPKFVSWFKLKMLDTSFLQRILHDTLSKRKNMNMRRNDFVELLLQVRDNLSDNTHFDTDTMVSQAITFFVAGFETTSNALAFVLYELCLRPDCQDRLREEINDTFHTDDDITFENIQKMKYLDMVLSETLRRYPFGPFLNRKCKEDYVIKETGLVIEKDTPILIPIDGIHNDPEYYPEPEKFDPERFVDGHKKYSQSCTYLPFGMGPRNCIGDRFGLICAKVGIVFFLRYFKVEKCEDTPVPLVLNPKSPFMMPIKGLKMTVKKA